jgi:hypothetical protein
MSVLRRTVLRELTSKANLALQPLHVYIDPIWELDDIDTDD